MSRPVADLSDYDEVIVDAIAAGRCRNARLRVADKVEVARRMALAQFSNGQIAYRLYCSPRHVGRLLRRSGTPGALRGRSVLVRPEPDSGPVKHLSKEDRRMADLDGDFGPTVRKVARRLDDAATTLDRRGWTRKAVVAPTGELDILGAILDAGSPINEHTVPVFGFEDDAIADAALNELYAYLPRVEAFRCTLIDGRLATLSHWNDIEARDMQEVQTALRTTAWALAIRGEFLPTPRAGVSTW